MSTLPAQSDEPFADSAAVTAEKLLKRRASQTPRAVALVDPPNREALSSSEPGKLSYADVDHAADAIAAFLVELGLVPGDRLVLQLPNFVEAPLVLLAAWRAGVTVAAIPMLWRASEIGRVCDLLEPKALIGISRFAAETPAETLRDVAATRMSVRFVLGFGPGLPDGVASLDDEIKLRGTARNFAPVRQSGPALITFTAYPGHPLVPLFRHEDEILAQGAMSVLSLSIDRMDTILNPCPLTGPVGIGFGLGPWLIGGAALVLHHPFEYQAFVEQLLGSGATITALPHTILSELAKDGVLKDRQCRLRRLGRVWSMHELTGDNEAGDFARIAFDVWPLGDLASLIVPPQVHAPRGCLPQGPIRLNQDGGTVFVESRLSAETNELMIRGPVVPAGRDNGPAFRDVTGYVSSGICANEQQEHLRLTRDPGLVYHGGFTIAMSELDGLYQAFPDFLDAACFVLPDPILGDRLFVAVAPSPNAPVSLAALHQFLTDRGVAPYKFPDKLLLVRDIPRGADGGILRDALLQSI